MRQKFPTNTFVAPKLGTGSRLVIAEAPGAEEAERGEPLVGGAGRWFDSMARAAGLKREELTLANCIQCRPPDNIFPTDGEARSYISEDDAERAVSHCLHNHLNPLLTGRAWKRVDLLGDKPLRLVGGRDDGIFRWRGSPISVPGCGDAPLAIPTLHPAYIMRDQIMAPVVVSDLRKPLDVPPEFYSLFPDLDEVRAFKHTEFAFDIETYGYTGDIRCVALCAKPSFAIVVPFRGAYIAELRRIFQEATSVIGHNHIQFDLPFLQDHGIGTRPGVQLWDTMLLQHLCFPDFPHDLEFVGSQFCGKPAWKDEHRDKDPNFYWTVRCARDADVTMASFRALKPMVEKYELMELYQHVQVPLAKICKLMHDTGFKIDPNQIKHVREKLLGEMADLEQKLPPEMRSRMVSVKRREPAPPGTLSEKTGKPLKYVMRDAEEQVVPWRSTETKKKFLYTSDEPWCLGLPVQKNAKSDKVTTGKDALDKLARKVQNPALSALKWLNKYDEIVTTFCKEGMLTMTSMHPHFNVHGTGTGRLSTSKPSLQNIPETARIIYVPSHAGWKIISLDFSGIENRLTAWMAGDTERLKRMDIPGFSEHKYLAGKLTGTPWENIKKSVDPDSAYSKAKHVVHGVDRGLGPQKASNMYDMDLKETKNLFLMWKGEIRPTIKWQEKIAEQAKKDGCLRNHFGRMRWFWTSSYYTEALSTPNQSDAADIIFRAMIGLMYERIGWPREMATRVAPISIPLPQPARLLLQVHDELVFEAPAGMVDEVIEVVKTVMTQPWEQVGGMRMPVNVAVGDSWGDVESYAAPVTAVAV